MREFIALLVFYVSFQIGSGNGVFLAVIFLVVSFLSIIYLAAAIAERFITIGNPFRIHPGIPTLMPWEKETPAEQEAEAPYSPEDLPPSSPYANEIKINIPPDSKEES